MLVRINIKEVETIDIVVNGSEQEQVLIFLWQLMTS